MKGYKFQTRSDDKKGLVDTLILKSLPYGKWTTKNGEEYLFNRDYEPILGYDLKTSKPIPVTPKTWVKEIAHDETLYFYKGIYPTSDTRILRSCWDVLAYWHIRL